jgi:hypothetical protein
MSNAYLSPILQDPQFNDDGTFLAGGLIWFYQAGTSTPILAYTTPLADTPWSNPIQLNARGETGGEIWLLSGSSYKMVVETPPQYGQAHGVVISIFDNITGVNDPGTTSIENWVAYSGTPTYISATSFSVTGDARLTFLIDRRVKMLNGDSTIFYATVVSTTFDGTITTIVVSPDYGQAVSSRIASVSYGFIETGNVSSIPVTVNAGSAAGGSQYQMWIDYNGSNLVWSKNADISSSKWPIEAATADASGVSKFIATGTSSADEARFTVSCPSVNDTYMFNNAASWGINGVDGGIGILYTRSTGKFSYGGFTLPAQTGISGFSTLPNGMIMQWGYSSSSNAGVTVTFPQSFTSAASYAVTTGINGTTSLSVYPIIIQNINAGQFVARQAAGDGFYWIAMGY